MGNAIHTLLFHTSQGSKVHITPMKHLKHKNLSLNLIRQPNNTYIFDELKDLDYEEFLEASFFNK